MKKEQISIISIKRLADKAKRWTHHLKDPKRVLLIDVGGKKIVVTLYTTTNEETHQRFKNNLLMYKQLAKHRIPCPKLLAIDEFSLVFVTEYTGQELPNYLIKAAPKESRDKINQAIEILQQMARINNKKHPFVMPERLKRFREFYETDKYNSLPIKTKAILGKFYDDLREIEQQNQNQLFEYGYGLSAADFIDFLVDEKGRVSIIDFDELIEFYDPLYGIGYFFVSLERAKNKKELRAHLFKDLDLTQPQAELRFKIGAITALSNQLRISYTNSEVITQRLKEIHKLWESSL